jgi:Domain of unknown function (DUF4188)
MPDILDRRVTAHIDGDFVVFLIGVRINKPWKAHKWFLVVMATPRMLKELNAAPAEIGCLGYTSLGMTTIVQYWRSFDHLERYARPRDKEHWPAWVEFNRRFKDSGGDVGIWHETYLVRAGEYETVYNGMPLFGLAKAAQSVAVAAGTDGARERLGAQGLE